MEEIELRRIMNDRKIEMKMSIWIDVSELKPSPYPYWAVVGP